MADAEKMETDTIDQAKESEAVAVAEQPDAPSEENDGQNVDDTGELKNAVPTEEEPANSDDNEHAGAEKGVDNEEEDSVFGFDKKRTIKVCSMSVYRTVWTSVSASLGIACTTTSLFFLSSQPRLSCHCVFLCVVYMLLLQTHYWTSCCVSGVGYCQCNCVTYTHFSVLFVLWTSFSSISFQCSWYIIARFL